MIHSLLSFLFLFRILATGAALVVMAGLMLLSQSVAMLAATALHLHRRTSLAGTSSGPSQLSLLPFRQGNEVHGDEECCAVGKFHV